MNVLKKSILLLLILFLSTGVAQAIPVIDGIMGDDWGTSFTKDEIDETQDGSPNSVGPGWGGQAFDVEKIGLQFDNEGNVYFGLQTGFDFVNGVNHSDGQYYTPGDIFINFKDNENDDVWDLAIDVKKHYIYEVVNESFIVAPVSFPDSGPFKYDSADQNFLDTAKAFYRSGTNENQEAIHTLEGVFNLSALGFDQAAIQSAVIHWTMSCGNDVLEHEASAPVPEPATLLLLGTGMIGIAGVRRKMQS